MKEKQPSLIIALIPIILLISLLSINVSLFGDNTISGSNQLTLLISAACAALLGLYYNIKYKEMLKGAVDSISSAMGALIILLLIGSLAGTWMMSGIVPSMIYFGLKLLSPSIFLVAACIICSIVSLATGSSWSTIATIGIAMLGIGNALGIPEGLTGGAIISGSYFGDKMSPLSDTTNLAPAMAGGELFSHIKYMAYTTIPTIVLTLVIFVIIGLNLDTSGTPQIADKLTAIVGAFNISPWLFIVPVIVILMIIKKTPPLIALLIGALLGGITAIIAQPEIIITIAGAESLSFQSAYKGVMNALTVDTAVTTSSAELNDLFTSGGMKGMLGTIWLIVCAMVFGGVMDAIGALSKITDALLKMATSVFGLFASTVASCLALNLTASDQYLALVVPGKMFKKAYKDRGLAPENLSRTLEDAGTVTSVLIPWNTCGAYHSKVLFGYAGATAYIPYAFFSIISPIMTLLFAAFQIKIKQLRQTT